MFIRFKAVETGACGLHLKVSVSLATYSPTADLRILRFFCLQKGDVHFGTNCNYGHILWKYGNRYGLCLRPILVNPVLILLSFGLNKIFFFGFIYFVF